MALTAVSHSGKRTSNVRWILVLVMCVVSFISYILRTNLSAVGDRMMTDLGLTQIQFGMVLSAFAWGYGIFQFPGGILGDIFGSR
jgi:sugar phosphate permease